VAWGARDPGSVLAAAPAPLAGQLRSLLAALRPVRLPAQLIHGDLGGNVLFAPGQPPAVIDFSPYWRPAGLALAIAAVDALTWSGADPAILGDLADQPELDQLLAAPTSAASSPRLSPGAAIRTLLPPSRRSRGPASR
jgi:hypothetical protein